ncbi:uncharacterized protein SPPG_08725 [Spizellomyces punctatus DAOM BR117]|uniref:Beta-glucuronidase C-terminal domain-containing protein n=1 Tax=Spizellomyces punctatus (strain DAOM BR117) TaxID=645134 RepID=A0A0L0H322_SPIPD|nr:uncharacterized protein SPPG_08725 [Spizellomyces punctatus DAOM BR117]KNC95860.1 hypothetical protein SPPG_08725 [Spizellomyces punctatus DAOM BR117]|eukprot:XP_016603900.1 hypothetical protein SPPG_08725 [Spizellomyces punctatus DAOM BR117]
MPAFLSFGKYAAWQKSLYIKLLCLFAFVEIRCLVHAAIVELSHPASNTTPSGLIDPSFVGFSVEWTHVDDALGPGPGANTGVDYSSNPIVVNLFRHLAEAVAGYPPTLRIGGNSATRLWWQGSILPRLSQSTWSVNAMELKIIQEFASSTGSRMVLTVPMLSPDPAYAVEFLVKGVIPNLSKDHILAIEIGNEPDHYEKNGRRPPGYSFNDFTKEFTVAYNAIVAAIGPGFDYQGPSYAYPWTSDYMIPFIQGQRGTKYISFHKYGQRGCSTATNPDAVTPLTLLADPAPEEYVWIDSLVQVAQAGNQDVVWGEGGSSSCNGTAGVSDTFASAIWTVDTLLEMAYRNVKYTSLSGAAQTYYAPYSLDPVTGRMSPRPTYYGMLMVNRILRGAGSTLFRASLDGGWALTGNSIKTWGVNNTATGEMTLVVIHKSPAANATSFTVQYPYAFSALSNCTSSQQPKGYITRLEAPALNAKTGVTINKQTWDNSLDGHPIGAYTEEIVEAQGQMFTFTVQQYSIVALRIGCTPGLPARSYTPPPVEPVNPGFTPVWGTPNPTPSADPDAPLKTEQRTLGKYVGIGVGAAVLGLACALALTALVRKRRMKNDGAIPTPRTSNAAARHPHPFAKRNPYLYAYAGEVV